MTVITLPATGQWGSDFSNPRRVLLTAEQIEPLFTRLELREGQEAVMQTMLDEYHAAHRQRVETLNEIDAKRRAIVSDSARTEEAKRSEAASLWRRAMEIGKEEHAAREKLRADLRLVLDATQLAAWDRFWRDHRRWTLLRGNHHFSEARVDLVALCDSFGDEVASGEVVTLLEEYATAIDPLIQDQRARQNAVQQRYFDERLARLEGTWRDPLAEVMNSDEVRALSNDDFHVLNARIRAAANERRIERLEPERRASRRIRDCNRTYLRRLASLLPTEVADRLEKRYLDWAFGRRFDSPGTGGRFRGHLFLERVLALDLTDDQRSTVQGIRQRYRERFDGIALKLVNLDREEEDEWAEIIRGSTPYAEAPTQIRIEEERAGLLVDRRELQESIIATVRSLLSPGQRAEIAETAIDGHW